MPAWPRNLSGQWRRVCADRSGASAVELSFVLPILIVMFLGLFDVSMVLWRNATLENAASEGARFAIVNGATAVAPATEASIETFVREQATGITAADLLVSVTFDPSNQPGSEVEVVLDYTHNFALGVLLGLPSHPITKRSKMIIF